MIYRAALNDPNVAAGPESQEVAFFPRDALPWDELAFPSVHWALSHHAETRGQTGVEMEALTAVQVALLTVYDMCKAVDRGMTITDVQLLKKSGGKSGEWERDRDG